MSEKRTNPPAPHCTFIEFQEKITISANQAWNTMYPDLLVDEDGNRDESATLTQEEVIEMVCDCEHMEAHGELTREEMKFFYSLPNEMKNRIMKTALPNEIYCY